MVQPIFADKYYSQYSLFTTRPHRLFKPRFWPWIVWALKDLIESIECPKTISVKVLESTEAHKDLSKFNVKFRLPLDLRKLEDISGKSFYYLLNGPFLPKMTFLEWNWRFWIFDKIFLFRKIIIYLLQIKILKIFKNLRDETERKNSHYYCLHDKSRDHEKRLDVSHVVAAFN